MTYQTTNHWSRKLGILAVMIALLTVFMTVTAQADGPEWRLPVTGLTAVAGDDPGEMRITWDAHTQTTKTLLNYRVAWTPQGESFKSADQTDWNVHTASNQHTVTGLDAGATYQVKVRTRYEGNQGSRWTEVVTGQAAAPTAPTNSAATGQPTITGTAEVGETLTAGTSGIADSNGLTNAVFTFQWVRSTAGPHTDISGATNSTYAITNADIDTAIKVRVNFSDDDGYSESVTSNATTSVPVPAPVIVPPEEPQIAQAVGDDDPTPVLNDWSLKPSGLGVDDSFRLIFLSSTKRNASSTSIGDYNSWAQGRAAAGHADIQAYSSGFTAVGCTVEDDARDNTGTTYTSTDKGVPIYWLNGNKVADEYEDFYDGDWDDEAHDKNESGNNGPDTSQDANFPFTGCDHDGTEDIQTVAGTTRSKGLGTVHNVRLARPNSSISGHGPLSSALNEASRSSYPPHVRPLRRLHHRGPAPPDHAGQQHRADAWPHSPLHCSHSPSQRAAISAATR